jgi:hypothetical protein
MTTNTKQNLTPEEIHSATSAALATITSAIRTLALAEIAKPEKSGGAHDWLKQRASCRISPVEDQAISWVGDHPIS